MEWNATAEFRILVDTVPGTVYKLLLTFWYSDAAAHAAIFVSLI
jgi:hypothetical protein